MSALVKRPRPQRQRAPVNYRVDDDSDADDSDIDAGVDDDSDDDAEQPFELFGLPQELRDMIYEEALVDPDGVHLAQCATPWINDIVLHVSSQGGFQKNKKQLSTNLMATSKRVYHETRLVAYRQPFIFPDPTTVHGFLHNLKPSTIGLLRDITIQRMRAQGAKNNPLLSGLRDAMSLKNLRLSGRVTGSNYQISMDERTIGVEIANKFFQDASFFIRPFIDAHGIDHLLQVVKFDEGDKRGDRRYGSVYRATWTAAQETAVMDAVKVRLLKLINTRKLLTFY